MPVERDIDLVVTVQEPVTDLLLDLERDDAVAIGDGQLIDVDPSLARSRDPTTMLGVEDDGKEPVLGAVDVEDVGE
jgi:hypothetical protein